MTREERIARLMTAIPTLSNYRLQMIDRMVAAFARPKAFWRFAESKLISPNVLEDFGDVLRMHHCFSHEPFSKDKFEYALERVLVESGVPSALAPRGQRGFDIQIAGDKFSLKTEAAKAIRENTIHISKFMELGGGTWGDDPADLVGLRQQFLTALTGIQRILVLRFVKQGEPHFLYELVEIPRALLMQASAGRLEMMMGSTQHPKPGYCHVEQDGSLLFSLYFDGGGERKLQIKGLQKSLCAVHATWQFSPLANTP
jgi:type II restriction enzyme